MIQVILKMIEVSLQKSVKNRLTDFENKLMVTQGKTKGEG